MLCCGAGGVLLHYGLGPAARAAINAGVFWGFGGGKERCTEPAEEGAPRPSERRRGRRRHAARWLREEMPEHDDEPNVRFGIERLGLSSLAGLLPDVAVVGAATLVAFRVGGRVAGSAAAATIVCFTGLRSASRPRAASRSPEPTS